MSCVEGRAHIFHCPEGLAFNSESYRCDWPDQVPDCDVECERILYLLFFTSSKRVFIFFRHTTA